MPSNPQENALKFQRIIQDKIESLLDGFAEGKISREQFHMLYERYNARLAIVDHALMSGNPEAIVIAQTGPPTLQIIEETRAKAIGGVIYHNKLGTLIEKLGTFDVPTEILDPILREYLPTSPFMTQSAETVHKIDETHWLLFSLGKYTTAAMLLRNEPSKQQMSEIRRLHNDFENANREAFQHDRVDADKLAYPFVVFVQKKLKK